MLTGKMVRVRYARDRIVPYYLDVRDESLLIAAEQLLELYRGMEGRTRGELEEVIEETFGDDASLVHQGLAKLLEDRCDFEVVSGQPPEAVRALVFRTATLQRLHPVGEQASMGFDRQAVLDQVAGMMNLGVEEVERSLFADLKSEQKLIRFKDTTAERLLERYNVALAQAVLLRATRVHVSITGEPPARYRQLLRQLKFRRLLCEAERTGPDSYTLHLDGPLSLFSSTNKYGLQLALFLPAVLLCKDFELRAELRWGAQRKPKLFLLTHRDRLVTDAPDYGMFTPPELALFVESFRKRQTDWEIAEETEVYPLGNGYWVPDFRLLHKASGEVVLLEVLGFWRKASAVKHLQLLQRHATLPYLLAVSDDLHIEEQLDELPPGLHRFRHMPLADEIARLAAQAIGRT
jgi:predicted nuclease of restriction endonuclease-like RecB superfamily